jgi:hypothetical protein
MLSIMETVRKRSKTGGRQRGTPNRVTTDIRQALRDLAEGNANRVQGWLDSVAENDPAEALRLWLALLRFVTPTLQASAIADLTPKSAKLQLAAMTDEDLMEVIVQSPEAKALVRQGVRTKDELIDRIAGVPVGEYVSGPDAELSSDELQR